MKYKYYDIRHLFNEYPDARYYVVYGERSAGKTYSALDYCLEHGVEKEQFAYIRRFNEDIRPKNLSTLYDAHLSNGRVPYYFGEKFNSIEYTGAKFYLTRRDDDGKKDPNVEPMIFGRAFDLNGMEHYKSIAFPDITTIIFDEFLSRQGYLPNEFILFQNALSTIIRDRSNVKIIMLGNTVSKYCPYFEEMGLKHIKDQAQGSVDVYRYGSSGLEVVVEYTESSKKQGGKKSDVYFAFDNPELKMITDGSWEIGIYPHLPIEQIKPKDIVIQFFIHFNKEILHGYVISAPQAAPFVYMHRKTTEIKRKDDIVYVSVPDSNPYHRFGLSNQPDKLSRFIKKCVAEGRVFYATNEDGETFRNYRLWESNARVI